MVVRNKRPGPPAGKPGNLGFMQGSPGRKRPAVSLAPVRSLETDFSELEERINNHAEAFLLLELIDAEFRTDPMSVQCFDLRIVQRVRACVEKHKKNLFIGNGDSVD